MLAGWLLAGSLATVIPDPRSGPSPWQLVDLHTEPAPAAGYLVPLPARVDEAWLASLVQLASSGAPVVSLGVPEKSLVAYFDAVVVASEAEAREVLQCCPGTPVFASARHPAEALEQLAWGVRGWLVPGEPAWARELAGAFPEPRAATAGELPLPTASREEDLALLVGIPAAFPGGELHLPSGWLAPGGKLMAEGAWEPVVVAVREEEATVQLPPLPQGGLLVLPRPLPPGGLEKVEVAGERGLSLSEILARHHRQVARQNRLVANFQAWQRLALRVQVGELGRSFEVVLAGPAFFTPELGRDWQVEKAWLDGVPWEVEQLPELPLLQPKAPRVPPLALELAPSYRYQLAGREVREGRPCYVVTFSQREAEGKRRGRAFLDAATFGLVALETVQESEQGEVRFSRTLARNALLWHDSTPLWLPSGVVADEEVAAFGGLATVHRELVLEGLAVNVPELPARRAAAWASAAPMFRERRGEVVPLEPDGQGGRREGSGGAKRQRFLFAGLAVDPSLSFPLPLAGYQLLDFDFRGQREQLRLFLAGAVNEAAWSRPGETELFSRAFLQLVPFTSSLWVRGEERKDQEVRSFRQTLSAGVAQQLGATRFSASFAAAQQHFARTQRTAPAFRLPRASQELTATLGVAIQAGEWLAQLQGERGWRLGWRSWGFGERARTSFSKAGATLRWEHAPWPLAKASFAVEAWSSSGTDRFSRFSLGSFTGGLSGIPGDRVGAEAYGALRGAVALPLVPKHRLELGVDAAWVRSRTDRFHARPVSGIALRLASRGPWRSQLELSLGMPLVVPGPNRPKFQLLLLRPL
jgi:hypothetical protein